MSPIIILKEISRLSESLSKPEPHTTDTETLRNALIDTLALLSEAIKLTAEIEEGNL